MLYITLVVFVIVFIANMILADEDDLSFDIFMRILGICLSWIIGVFIGSLIGEFIIYLLS